jgi:polar amino acid transport system substrate-binding protein
LTAGTAISIFFTILTGMAFPPHAQPTDAGTPAPLPSSASDTPLLVLSSEDGTPFSRPDQTGVIDQILMEAFGRLGVRIRIISVPAERALLNVNDGIEDGNFLRVAGLSARYPNLVQVPEALWEYEFVAFSRRVDVRTSGWESLQPFDVAIITGWKILEDNVRATRSLQKVRDQVALFNLLAKDRADLVLYSRLGGEFTIRELGLKGIKALDPPLARREMFLYLNRKHAGLAAALADALRTMKTSGDYQRVADRAVRP